MNALEALAIARELGQGWTYGPYHNEASKSGDCMFYVDVWARRCGIAERLGPIDGYNVTAIPYATTLPKAYPPETPLPGDVVILGDPNGVTDRAKYAHIGIATETQGAYASAYNVGINVIERPIYESPHMQLVLILRTGFDQTGVTVMPDPNEPRVIAMGDIDGKATVYRGPDSSVWWGTATYPATTGVPIIGQYRRAKDLQLGYIVDVPQGQGWVSAAHVVAHWPEPAAVPEGVGIFAAGVAYPLTPKE